MDIKDVKQFCINEGKDILFKCYKEDPSFPSSCARVSLYLATMLYENKDIRNNYDIKYVRGHFKNEEEECCDDYTDVARGTGICKSSCTHCTCDFMTAHSWVEISKKDGSENYIVDLTSSQFHEAAGDLKQSLYDEKYEKEELLILLRKYSKFFINLSTREGRGLSVNYILDEHEYSGEYLKNCLKDICNMHKVPLGIPQLVDDILEIGTDAE